MILDLPLHPLLVHLPVVLIPVAFVLVTIAVLWARTRPQLALVGTLLAVVGGLGTVAAYFSGGLLAESVGDPTDHSRWGLPTMIAGLVFAVLAVLWWTRQRRDAGGAGLIGGLTVVAAVVATTFVVLAGHSGASAVWEGTETGDAPAAPASPSPTDEATDTPAPTATSTAPEDAASETMSPTEEPLTLAEVEANASPESCWVAIDGTVYDLTDWISQHPGGPERIEGICGTDATDAFTGQHEGQSAPMEALAQFELGPLTD